MRVPVGQIDWFGRNRLRSRFWFCRSDMQGGRVLVGCGFVS